MFDLLQKISFKIYKVKTWLINNYKTHIAQYFKKKRQPDNEIFSDNRILLEKHFTSKIMHKMRQRD